MGLLRQIKADSRQGKIPMGVLLMAGLGCGLAAALTLSVVVPGKESGDGVNRVRVRSVEASNFIHQVQAGKLTQQQVWNLRTTVEPYLKMGNRNQKWDALALTALEIFAITRGMMVDKQCQELLQKASACAWQAQSLGCRDPLVHYLSIRLYQYKLDEHAGDFSGFDYKGAAEKLWKSQYPINRKILAWTIAVSKFHEMREEMPDKQKILAEVQGKIPELLAQEDLPMWEAFNCLEEIAQACGHAGHGHERLWQEIDRMMPEALKSSYYACVLKGRIYLDAAWEARGDAWAKDVTEEQWRLMGARLKVARQSLEKAWQLNPRDWRGPTLMLGVMLLDGSSDEARETWFERAMRNNTNNIQACFRKLNYLETKWGGSASQQLAFGRQCLASTQWHPLVAEVLVRAHGNIFTGIPTDPKDQQQVWNDIEAAYGKLLAWNPYKKVWKEDLEHWKFLCGKKKFGSRNSRKASTL